MKKRVLFLIHDLGQGGAEKVLINLVNNFNLDAFDVSVIALFGGGVNEQFLKSKISYSYVFKKPFKGNSHFFKLFSPRFLHNWLIKEEYDIEISYLEGPCSRIISGCRSNKTKLVAWIHCTMHSARDVAHGFRSYKEAVNCYNRFNFLSFVSEDCLKCFANYCKTTNEKYVLYNTNETAKILDLSKEDIDISLQNSFSIISIGKIEKLKGFDRLLRVHKKLIDDGYNITTCVLGIGQEEEDLHRQISILGMQDSFFLLGYQINPYKYLSKFDLYVCSSYSEGFSTAATEALIVGTPVCTVDVSGMKELLGNNEYGVITENEEEKLYMGIKELLDNPDQLALYKQKAKERGAFFSTERTTKAVEEMLTELVNNNE